MLKSFRISLTFLLASCVASPSASSVRSIGPAEAQAIIYDATVTAAIEATRVARVTEDWQARVSADVLAAKQTQDAFNISLAQDNATRQAVISDTLQAIRLQEDRQLSEVRIDGLKQTQDAQAFGQIALGVSAILLSLVVFLFGLLGLRHASDMLEARALRSLKVDTPLGPILVYRLPSGEIAYRPIQFSPPQLSPPRTDAQAPIESIPVKGVRPGVIDADWRDDGYRELRAQLIELVKAALEREGAGGTRIPRYALLRGWESRPHDWVRLTDALRDAGIVFKVSNDGPSRSGTFLAQRRTLYALLSGLSDGSISLAPVEVINAQ